MWNVKLLINQDPGQLPEGPIWRVKTSLSNYSIKSQDRINPSFVHITAFFQNEPDARLCNGDLPVLVCDPAMLNILCEETQKFNEFVLSIFKEKNGPMLLIIRVGGVTAEDIMGVAPTLYMYYMMASQHRLDADMYQDSDDEKLAEAIFEKLFGYIVHCDGPQSNNAWNTQGTLAANQIPTCPARVNQIQADGNGESVTEMYQCQQGNDNFQMVPGPQQFREGLQQTDEMLREACYSKQSLSQDVEIQGGARSDMHGQCGQRRVCTPLSVEESHNKQSGAASYVLQFPPAIMTQNRVRPPEPTSRPGQQINTPLVGNPFYAEEAPGEATCPKTLSDSTIDGYLLRPRQQHQDSQRRTNHFLRSSNQLQQQNQYRRHIASGQRDERSQFEYTTGPAAAVDPPRPSNDRLNEKMKDLQEEILFELTVSLDPWINGKKNWRVFASHKGIPGRVIDYLEKKGHPTQDMIKRDEFRDCTVGQFMQLCCKFKRRDVIEDVFEEFGYYENSS